MKLANYKSRVVALGLAAGLAAGGWVRLRAAEPRSTDGRSATDVPASVIFGISRASKEAKLAFPMPGIVAELKVEPGDHVKLGQILAGQDDREEQQSLKSLKREAESDAKIEYSKADKVLKESKRDRIKGLFDKKIAAPSEMEDAIQAVLLADAQIRLAEIEHDQKNYDSVKEQIKIDRMHMTAPFDGVVKKLNIEVGEMADPQNRDGSVVIAKWDPLKIELTPDWEEAKGLQMGQELKVKYEGSEKELAAKIYFLDQYDAASGSRMVWLSLPNPEQVPPGLRLSVQMPGRQK